MAPVWLLTAVAIGIVGVLFLWRRHRTRQSVRRSEPPVLPAHYSSLLSVDRSHYPGLCSACGTENTPGYNYCRECGERLPGGTETRETMELSKIFGE